MLVKMFGVGTLALSRIRYAVYTPTPRAKDPHVEDVLEHDGILQFLISTANKVTENTEDYRLVSEILWYLSKIYPCASYLSKEPACLTLLQHMMEKADDEELLTNASGAIIGIAWPIENRALTMQAFLTTIVNTLQGCVFPVPRRHSCTTVMILANTEEYAIKFMEQSTHLALLDILRPAPVNPASWGEGWNYSTSIEPYALSCLMKLAQWEGARDPLRQAGALAVITPMMSHESYHIGHLIASIIVVFLIGSEEGEQYTRIASDSIVAGLITLLENTVLRRGDSKYYNFGYFKLDMVLLACNNVALSDFNRCKLAVPAVRDLILKVLRESSDKGEIESASKLLLNLSFIEESDAALQSPGGLFDGVLDDLMACKARVTVEFDAYYLLKLIARLTPKVAVAEPPRKQQHVMLSYCWNKNAKPHLVEALYKALLGLDYEVWRDVNGSSLLGSMSGSTDEKMAAAIELAHTVVICVSKEYKKSANCRLEANYSNQRQKLGRLNVVYVMMQEEYTTVSAPESVDGYLGLMVGASLWYPLWSEGMVADTAQAVASAVGDNARTVRVPLSLTETAPVDAAEADRPIGPSEDLAGLQTTLRSLEAKIETLLGLVLMQNQKVDAMEAILRRGGEGEEGESKSSSFLRSKYTFK